MFRRWELFSGAPTNPWPFYWAEPLAALNFANLVRGTAGWFFGDSGAAVGVIRTLFKYGFLGLILFAALAVLHVRIVGFCIGLSCLPLAVALNMGRLLDGTNHGGKHGTGEGDE